MLTPTTVDLFPQGEAIHFRQRALALGVPEGVILVETKATNTRENIEFTRALLLDHGLVPDSVLVVSRPYQQRRALRHMHAPVAGGNRRLRLATP